MGGTFDPIHYGHLAAAEEARQQFGLERVVFVPNGQPPHKQGHAIISGEHRYAMAVLATASNPWFEASRMEVDRAGPCYTVDTMREFRRRLGSGAALFFITGVDAILELSTWREPRRLAELCEFIAVARPGYEADARVEAVAGEVGARIHLLRAAGVAVSSTELRRRAATGRSLRHLTPGPVAGYIEAHRLYRGGP